MSEGLIINMGRKKNLRLSEETWSRKIRENEQRPDD